MNANAGPADRLREFLQSGVAGGVVLMLAAVLALIMANSPAAPLYDLLLHLPVEIRVGPLEVAKPLLLWINDGMMAVFFFLVGLELKEEFLDGELSDPQKLSLPLMAAIGGMAVPALIYVWINWDMPAALDGWAIPAATDIAFALGVLMLLGDRVPVPLKVFLVSLAIIDDIGAIVIIALFYTDKLSLSALALVAPCLLILTFLNRRGVAQFTPYLLTGFVMWLAVLKSGVHATLAGVLLAMFVPMHSRGEPKVSPLRDLQRDLQNAVSFGILPIFAFANAGVSFEGLGFDALLHPIPLGIAAGLFFGKQIGVFGLSWLTVRCGLGRLPAGVSWTQLYGVAVLSGIGFTMSLFIGALAFEGSGVNRFVDERLGILVGSLFSAVVGYTVLRYASPLPQKPRASAAEAVTENQA